MITFPSQAQLPGDLPIGVSPVTLSFSPAFIEPGQSTQLRWSVSDTTINACRIIDVPGVRNVQPNGSLQLTLTENLRAIIICDRDFSKTAEATVIVREPADPIAPVRSVSFAERTSIDSNNYDTSGFFGFSDRNFARTKDADIADINQDGYMDILDANSNNETRQDPRDDSNTQVVIRLNNGGSGFTSFNVPGIDNATTYDADLVDLNGDSSPDLIRAEAIGNNFRVSVYLNRNVPGRWFDLRTPDFQQGLQACPDDIAFGDLDNDGDMDFSIAQRTLGGCAGMGGLRSRTSTFLNNGRGTNYQRLDDIEPSNAFTSTHDTFYIDAENDGDLDIILVNERGDASQLYLNDGNRTPRFTRSIGSFSFGLTGATADFNGDGLDDFVVAGGTAAGISVYINNFNSPGTFTELNFPNGMFNGFFPFYDVEIGDLDLDGNMDIIAAGNSEGAVLLLNDGGPIPSFTLARTAQNTNVFGNIGDVDGFQPLSVDLIDFDRDGDLDLYVAGSDGGGPVNCRGCTPNQFYENLFQ
jgi:hypothetical protein